ncbi:MAG: electron transfer flavoprotein subunit alpha/FixB family protein [Desulfobacterales bacterium]|nr:electron transfer flavoprotein subunit alpha/FixB family protein [Desulfobacterales bacterium]
MAPARIVLIADVEEGRLDPAVWELAAMASAAADEADRDVRWMVLGHEASSVGGQLAAKTGCAVTVVSLPPAAAPTGALWSEILRPILDDWQPDLVGMLHTTRFQDCAAALALALDAAWIAAVQGVYRQVPTNDLVFQRTVMGGRMTAEIETGGRPAVITVLPGYFPYEDRETAPAAIEMRTVPLPASRIRLVAVGAADCEPALKQAETIVAAGRGIGSPENLALVERLAACFPRSALAGSRIVCDAGWLAPNRQVGVTGASVAPKLYIACGISGAHQHVGGMQGAELVVAINRDSRAAIFNHADIGVVADLEVFLPLLIEALEKEEMATD